MTVKNDKLEELVKEQTALQCNVIEGAYGRVRIEDRTIRNRDIEEYGREFFPPECSNNIYSLLDDMITNKDKVVWIDLGCGHAIALRGGKNYFEKKGALGKIRAYGYDAIPLKKIRKKSEILKRKYAPKIIQADIETVVFEEKPDIVTACCSLFWTKDPLQVFANAARQAKKGSVLCFNNLDRITTDDYLAWNLFEKIKSSNGGIPGFDIINLSKDAIVARKVSNHKDYTYGFRLVSRYQALVDNPFRYVYTSDFGSNGGKREF